VIEKPLTSSEVEEALEILEDELDEALLEAEELEELASEEEGVEALLTLLEELGSEEEGATLLEGELEELGSEDGVEALLEAELGSLFLELVWEFTLLELDSPLEEGDATSLLKEPCSLERRTSLLSNRPDSSLEGELENGMVSWVMLLQEAIKANEDKASNNNGVFFIK